MQAPRIDDQRLEQIVGNLLRAGVSVAAVVVLLGAGVYLWQNHGPMPDYSTFRSPPAETRTLGAVFHGVMQFDGRALIQLGLLLLLATPIARVILSAFAFAVERDWRYTFLTLLVLAILTYSLIHGYSESIASP
jgi:uncharacterized membrane protein